MIDTIVGATLGIKLVNGKIKPKYGISGILFKIIVPIITLGFIGAFIYGIINLNVKFMIMPLFGILGFSYLMMISPYFQSSKNFYIEFENEDSLNNFQLYYKNKKVKIKCKIDSKDKIAFLINESKLQCISYDDYSKMSNFTKYKIINYFAKWLSDNNLLSNEVTSTFEEL